MSKYKIYVADQLIDLDPKSVIGLTLQATTIGSGDLVNRKASYTNQIKVPRTTTNVDIFEHANILQAVTTTPYTKLPCRINCNGIEILSGVAVIKSFDRYFNLQIFSLPKDIAIQLGTKVLSDLDFGDSPVTWNAAFIDSKRASTTGFCCPVIDYGQIDPTAGNGTVSDFYLPCIALKDIITAILDNAGYTISGSFYTSDSNFNQMVLSYSRDDWPGTSFKMNEVLSDDILQVDFMRDFLVKFGAGLRITGLDVEVVTLQDIVGSGVSTAVDWTEKRANKKESISYALDGWAQMNRFTYPPRQYNLDLLDPTRKADDGHGDVEVTNTNIPLSRNVYQSITYLHEQPVSIGSGEPGIIPYKVAAVDKLIFGATMPVWDTTPIAYEPFTNTPLPMLCLLRDKTTITVGGTPYTETTIRYNGNDRGDYKVAYVAPTTFSDLPLTTTQWRGDPARSQLGFLDYYYAAFETTMQAGTKKVTRQYRLTDLDIYALDLLKLIVDNDEYFMILKVGPYVSGRVTDVELLKI